MFLGLQNEREWVRFCEQVLQRPELAIDVRFESNAKRVEHRFSLEAEINSVFGKLNVEEIIARLELAKIANARMNTVAQLADHPQLAARQRWREVSTSVGSLRATLPPATIDGVEARFDPIPDIGANTDSILEELGYSEKIVSAWREDGLI